jgi:hypothetical protein
MVAAAVHVVLSWCNPTLYVSIPLCLLQTVGLNSSWSTAWYGALFTVCPWSWQRSTMGPLKSTSFCWQKAHFWISWSWMMIYVSNLWSHVCSHVHSGACDNLLQEGLSFYLTAKNAYVSKHACLCSSLSCFGTHLAQISWHLRSLQMMECANPQLMSNLSAMSVTVICLFSWNRPLPYLTLSNVHGWIAGAIFINDTCSAISETFHQLVHLPLYSTVFSLLC